MKQMDMEEKKICEGDDNAAAEGKAKKRYYITEASAAVEVENHVLRYWEEELELPVRRNEQGHRYYTEEDIRLLRKIKKWKDQGLQLKAIKLVLKGLSRQKEEAALEAEPEKADNIHKNAPGEVILLNDHTDKEEDEKEQNEASKRLNGPAETPDKNKVRKLRAIIRLIVQETLDEYEKSLQHDIRDIIAKEMDYQFRMWKEEQL